MDRTDCEVIEILPGKVSGVPSLKGLRVQADSIAENAESGESVDDIAYNFALNPEDVRRVPA